MKKLRDILEFLPVNSASSGEVEGLGENPPVGKRRNPQLFSMLRRKKIAQNTKGKKNVGGRR